MAAAPASRSSRTRGRWSGSWPVSIGRRKRASGRSSPAPSRRWRRAASTIRSAEASIDTRRIRGGSCRTSRRCCTTTQASWRTTFTRGNSPATRSTARPPKGSSPGRKRFSRTASAAVLEASMAFGREDVRAFALKSLGRVLSEMWSKDRGMWHAFADGDRKVRGLLEDHVYVVDAALAAYTATAEPEYLRTAEEIMVFTLNHFWDKEGGFVDIATDLPEGVALTLRSVRRRVVDGDDAYVPPPVEPMLKTNEAKTAPVAFVCQGQVCSPPTSDPTRLRTILEAGGTKS